MWRHGPGEPALLERGGSRRSYLRWKRIQDVALSLLALAVLWPLLLIICLLVVADDPRGGPIFRQERVGRGGPELSDVQVSDHVRGRGGAAGGAVAA